MLKEKWWAKMPGEWIEWEVPVAVWLSDKVAFEGKSIKWGKDYNDDPA